MAYKYLLFLFIYLSFTNVYGQEEEYYKVPASRSKSHEIGNLPNLDSKFTTFYFGLTGGFRKPYFSVSKDFEEFGENKTPFNDFLGANFGFNMNNNFFIETGISRLKNDLKTYVYPDFYNERGFILNNESTQYYAPITFKKKVLNLNKVTFNASINLIAGLGIMVGKRPKGKQGFMVNLQENIRSPYLSSFYVTSGNSQRPIYGEFGVELKGNITERLELLVFTKGILRQNKYLQNSFNVNFINSNDNRNYFIYEKPFSLVFGLQARFNSRKFYRYSSRI